MPCSPGHSSRQLRAGSNCKPQLSRRRWPSPARLQLGSQNGDLSLTEPANIALLDGALGLNSLQLNRTPDGIDWRITDSSRPETWERRFTINARRAGEDCPMPSETSFDNSSFSARSVAEMPAPSSDDRNRRNRNSSRSSTRCPLGTRNRGFALRLPGSFQQVLQRSHARASDKTIGGDCCCHRMVFVLRCDIRQRILIRLTTREA